MEAKDTVIFKCMCASYDFEPFYSPWDKEHKELHHCYECDAYNEGKLIQAEISFKAGRESILDEAFNKIEVIEQSQKFLKGKLNDVELAIQQARLAGIKEVVDWLQEFAIHGGRTPLVEVLDIMAVHSPLIRTDKDS